MNTHLRFYTIFFTTIFILSIGACRDNALTPPSQPNNAGVQSQVNAEGIAAGLNQDKFITSDPVDFVKKLKEIDNDLEVLIVLKEAAAPRVAKATLKEIPASGTIALPEAAAAARKRTSPGLARVNAQSRQSVKAILNSKRVSKVVAPDFGHIITATLTKENAKGVITALLNNPNVDYIEANKSHPVQFDTNPAENIVSLIMPAALFGNPQGSNPSDQKHTFHDVLDAWDYTRGADAKVGILDSGFSYDQTTNSYHPDGQILTSTKGIKALGFVDDFDSFGNCSNASGQPYGNCLGWDDHGHGTAMTGLAGSNDNSLNYVGIMPDGLTISMKIAQNCYITQGCANDDDDFNIESDDLYWAIEWARNNDLDVLSMSFNGTDDFITASVYNSLYDAYHTDNIVLLAATGNPGDPKQWDYPQKYNFVIGVGGLNSDGSNYGKDEFEDVSALRTGGTTDAYCPGNTSFCEPSGDRFSGGTSTSTAIAAGIVGLVRSYNPSLTAPQVRQRLINTSEGPHNQINAYVAVTNDYPLSVYIAGPGYISNSGSYSWEAMAQNGNSGYSYVWEYREGFGGNWTQVATSKTYNRGVATGNPNFQLRVTVTSGPEQDTALKYVTVASEDCPPGQICAN